MGGPPAARPGPARPARHPRRAATALLPGRRPPLGRCRLRPRPRRLRRPPLLRLPRRRPARPVRALDRVRHRAAPGPDRHLPGRTRLRRPSAPPSRGPGPARLGRPSRQPLSGLRHRGRHPGPAPRSVRLLPSSRRPPARATRRWFRLAGRLRSLARVRLGSVTTRSGWAPALCRSVRPHRVPARRARGAGSSSRLVPAVPVGRAAGLPAHPVPAARPARVGRGRIRA